MERYLDLHKKPDNSSYFWSRLDVADTFSTKPQYSTCAEVSTGQSVSPGKSLHSHMDLARAPLRAH